MNPGPSARPEWMDLKSVKEYADVSIRTLGDWIRNSLDPLPASRVGKKMLVSRTNFDAYMERHRVQPDSLVDDIVEEVCG
jgi:Helix-turn-helix domain